MVGGGAEVAATTASTTVVCVGVPAAIAPLFGGARGIASTGVEEDGSDTALPVLEKASANLLDGTTNALGGALNFDNAFGRLREHVLGGYHAGAGRVLNHLDLKTGSADDGTHEVVGDEEAEGGVGRDGDIRLGGGRGRGGKELGHNERICL